MTSSSRGERQVDWVALRERLDATRDALARADVLDDEETRSILEQRAVLLAKRVEADDDRNVRQMITFRLGSESCAIDATLVLHVFRLGSLALLPGAPAPIHGVTMWRGEVLTLLDLRTLLGITTNALSDMGRVIVVGRDRAAFGFVVDSVTGARTMGQEEMHSASSHAGRRHPLVSGITSDALLVLDGDEVLGLGSSGGQT